MITGLQYETQSIKKHPPNDQEKEKMTIQVTRDGDKNQIVVMLEQIDIQQAMKLQIEQIKTKAANSNYNWEIFDIKQEIGAGTFGQVYASLDQKTQKKYALKFIGYDNEADTDPDFKSAVREIVIMQALSKPDCKGLLKIFDVYPCIKEDNKYLVIVMELCDCNLMELLKVRIDENMSRWTDQELLFILYQLVEGFLTMKKLNITHRDVKPQNILYSCQDKSYKIADLGGAKFLKPKPNGSEQINTVRGSPAYWAPEIYYFCDLQKDKDGRFFVGKQHLPYDPYISDVYSIGITILLMKQLKPRIDRESLKNELEILKKVPNPSSLEVILVKMLESDYRKRIGFEDLFNQINNIKDQFRQPNEDVFVTCLKTTQEKKNLSPQDLMLREIKLAEAYEKLNLIEHAKSHYELALRYSSKLSKDSSKADILNSLGTVNCYLDLFDDAEKYYQESVVLYKKLYGDKHTAVADAYNNIGIVKRKKQEYQAAIKYYEQAYQIKEQVFGENNLESALILSNIGLTYRKLGNLDMSIKYYKNALQIKKLLCGDRNTVLCGTYDNLARVYYLKQQYDLAISCYSITTEIYRKNPQTNQTRLSDSLFELGMCYQKVGRFADAIKTFEETYLIRKSLLGQYAKATIQAQEHLAQCILEEGNYQKALDLYKFLKEAYIQNLIKVHIDEKLDSLSDIMKNIGASYQGLEKYDETIQSYQESITYLSKRSKDQKTDESSRLSKIYYNMGLVYRKRKDFKKAQEYYDKALFQINQSKLQADIIFQGDIYNNMGVLFGMQDNFELARQYFVKSYDCYFKTLGQQHKLCRDAETNIVEVDKWLKKSKK